MRTAHIKIALLVTFTALTIGAASGLHAATNYWEGPNAGGTGDGVSDGGSGTWSTSVANWDAGNGVARREWDNGGGDSAIFGANGASTVTLAEDINLQALSITNLYSTRTYTITGNTLNFSAGGSITAASSGENIVATFVDIQTAISGAPDVVLDLNHQKPTIAFNPTAGSVTLGDVSGGFKDGKVSFGGSTSGSNSVGSISFSGAGTDVSWTGGTWTLNGISSPGGQNVVAGGNLIVANSGHLNGNTTLSGGTLVVNGVAGLTTMQTGATMKGTGVVTCASVPEGAILAPGDPTGMLTLTNGNCTIAGTLVITIDGAQNSTLAVDGNLSVTNATLDVTVSSAPLGDVIIATYETLGHPFEIVTGATSYTIDYAYKGSKAIALIPPPRGTVLMLR